MRVIISRAAPWVAAVAIILVPACGSDGDGGNGPPPGDDLEVASVHPADGATQADANSSVSVVFDRELNAGTVVPAAFVLTTGTDTLETVVQYNTTNHSVAIEAPLLPGQDYQAVVATTVSGADGEGLADEFQWNFTTRAWQEASLGPINGSSPNALLVDDGGTLHLLYWEVVAGPIDVLRYGTCASQCRSAANWTMVSLDTTNSGGPVGIAIGSGGETAIAYQLGSSADLRFGLCVSGCLTPAGWALTTVGLVPGNEGYSMVGLAAESGGFHILTGVGNGAIIELAYAGCPANCAVAANWSFNTADAHALGSGVLARSPDGTLHLLYNVTDNGAKLRYANCSSGCFVTTNWQHVDLGFSAGNPALVADDGGELHAVVSRSGIVEYLHCPGPCLTANQWSSTLADDYQSSPPHAGIAVGPGGRLHVVIASDDNQELRYANCVTTCTSESGWEVTGTRPATILRHPKVVVDGAGFVHSIFEDLGTGTLKAAE